MFRGGDYPAPSALDSILWLGVQPAVKEMFIKLLKTVEHQSSELNRLDQQYQSFLLERDGSVRILMDKVSDSYSCINTKAEKRSVAGLKREMLEVREHSIIQAEQYERYYIARNISYRCRSSRESGSGNDSFM